MRTSRSWTTPPDGSASRVRENRGLLVVAVLLLAVAGFLAAPSDTGRVLDPRSTGAVGFAGGVRVLEQLGADVRIDALPGDDDATVIVTRTTLDDDQLAALRDHVQAGGSAVVFDPSLPFATVDVLDRLTTTVYGPTVTTGTCDLLAGYVDEVASADWTVLAEGVDGDNCLPVGAGVGLRVVGTGDGRVLVLGSASPFINDNIGDRDHARLLAALVLPDGPGTVVVLDERRPDTAEAQQSVLSLVTPRFWAPAGLLLAGLLLLGWSRSRRLERPVDEALLVRVPGSELALAIGDLLDRHGHRDAAASRLRDDLRREIAGRLDLPRDTDAATVATILAERVPAVAVADLAIALGDQPVTGDADLVRLGTAIARLRRTGDHPQ